MSFSDEVRKEICRGITDKEKEFSCLCGMIVFSRVLSRERICFHSKNSIVSEAFQTLFGKVFGYLPKSEQSAGSSEKSLSTFEISDGKIIEQVFSAYGISGGERKINREMIETINIGVFVSGIFLACGSVNDPEKEYHLEFKVPDGQLAADLSEILEDIDINARTAQRRGQHIVYIKGSESIEDTLTFMGAKQCTLDLMNVKIYKDVRNKANRIANCDNANIDKVVAAAMKQIEDIIFISKTKGLESLTDELREVAELRLENTGMSLQEIGENLSVPISRSGVNHRFKKLAKIADEIRRENSNGK